MPWNKWRARFLRTVPYRTLPRCCKVLSRTWISSWRMVSRPVRLVITCVVRPLLVKVGMPWFWSMVLRGIRLCWIQMISLACLYWRMRPLPLFMVPGVRLVWYWLRQKNRLKIRLLLRIRVISRYNVRLRFPMWWRMDICMPNVSMRLITHGTIIRRIRRTLIRPKTSLLVGWKISGCGKNKVLPQK